MDLKNVKKGDKVIMRLFTGAFSGVKEVEKADKDFIYFETRKGMSKFSKKTGKMVEPAPKNERFASYIEEYDEDVVNKEEAKNPISAKTSKPVSKKTKKVAKKVEKPAVEEDPDEDEEYEEVE